jgi:hypothetical protein
MSKKSFIEEWDEKYGKWETIEDETEYNTIIGLTKELEPSSTSGSLHIHQENYLIDGKTYRLLYAIGYDYPPTIEIKVN